MIDANPPARGTTVPGDLSEASLVVGLAIDPEPIHACVARAAQRWPHAPAVSGKDGSLTYAELWEAAGRWSGLLADRGVVEGDVVVVGARRSASLVACLLGILLRGATYSVVDPGWPLQRRRDLVADLRASLAVGLPTVELELDHLPEEPLHCPDSLPARAARPGARSAEEPACIFFTSGSTGRPKPVRIPHRSITRLFGSSSPLPLGPGHVVPSLAAMAWDGFALEVWSQLTTGGLVLLHSSPYFLPGDMRACVAAGATDVFLTAGIFDIFVSEDAECFTGLSSVWVGGDRLPPAAVSRMALVHPDIRVLNIYGPVECGVMVAVHDVTPEDAQLTGGVPVGRVAPGTTIAIVDESGVVLRGTEGDVWVGGAAVADGYVGDVSMSGGFGGPPPGLPSGAATGSWYRVGDRAVMAPDGLLHFRGRLDRQVKIGGHRVEPAEVEAVARQLGCAQACVVPVRADGSVTGLAMAAVPIDGEQPTPRRLREAIAAVLPPQLVPWPIVFVPELELNATGKVDRDGVERMMTGGRTA